ncbi:MAG: hypothetical protein QF535_04010 [Anaerolineales bacterium]|jgi:hypothetical protein|nr:hypothetical protein [Anaerolineales bacterium]
MENICEIISSTFYEIVCEMPAFTAPTDVVYIGGRGLRRLFWNNTNADFDDLDGVIAPT